MAQTVDAPETTDAGGLAGTLRARLNRPMPTDRVWGWIGPLLVGAVAAVLRLVDLGRPHKIIFDETYYAKDALSQLKFGYARSFVEDADERILNGNLDVFTDEASFVVHPPVGKFLIAQGIRLLGMEPAGWRLATALAGVVTVILVARVGRRMFRSTLLGCVAGLLLAVDGLSITMSRTAVLDGILTMFVVAAFACLLVDRDRMREKFAAFAARASGPLGDGPVFAWRPWRLVAGIALGLACGTKWSGIYAVAVFGLMTVLWEVGARRAAGIRSPVLNTLLRDGPVAFVTMIGPALATYIASWSGWITSDNGWGRQWAESNPATGLGVLMPDWLRSLWNYHADMWNFHTGLSSEHDYASQAWSWLYLGRPVSFDYQGLDAGQSGCEADRCSQAVLALGTPPLWWGACAALVACLWWWFFRRDWRAGAILAGVVATWVPWLFFTDRTIFYFYAVLIAPFLVLAVTFALGKILGEPDASPRRRAFGAAVAGGYVLVVVAIAAWFYPIHVDQVIPYDDWHQRMWFDSWI
ncbi:dolichyl-phosphate-mannose-protein mannosyltransferase [Haloactinopolyspora alba]|uniref:Polyprenol-phosphate-mannose--protein mannosyltransferase n=1 Tax=Haloactinopolyspora alba TaxID=648780 RepID=A0A2P8E575_9ACTN|nr:phospholipid carrier-dependent glycosyltransferase [Haloactinopolyspora alba]PSL04634.1 dolichyl-phosphate-mannose-protein mannosyltransferase [Haloactinopolyspora alba]